jgi:hypothetical protein
MKSTETYRRRGGLNTTWYLTVEWTGHADDCRIVRHWQMDNTRDNAGHPMACGTFRISERNPGRVARSVQFIYDGGYRDHPGNVVNPAGGAENYRKADWK